MTAIATQLLCLPGGAHFTARPIHADDKPALLRFFDRLSAESRRRRFLGPKPRLTTRELAFLTEVDQCSHVALVAVDRNGAIVAVARYNAWSDRPGHAELAVAVVDEWHGRGLGSALTRDACSRTRAARTSSRSPARRSRRTRPRARCCAASGSSASGNAAGVSEYVLALGAAAVGEA